MNKHNRHQHGENSYQHENNQHQHIQQELSQEWRKSLPSPQPKRDTWRVVISALIGLLIGLGIGFLASDSDSPEPNDNDNGNGQAQVVTGGDTSGLDALPLPGSTQDDRTPLETPTTGVNEVQVKDQPQGGEVFISRVELTQSGWVAIHDNLNGQPGSVLGAKRFDAGIYQGTVNLLRGTRTGNTYHAVLWSDNGDGEFSIDTDSIIPGTDLIFKAL